MTQETQQVGTSSVSVVVPIVIFTMCGICIGGIIGWWSYGRARRQEEEIARLNRRIKERLNNATKDLQDISTEQNEESEYISHLEETIEIQQRLVRNKEDKHKTTNN
jgi:hypothetical protein